jgi:hypothetical protein
LTSAAVDPATSPAEAAIRKYELLCLGSLLVLLVILVERGFGWWSILPILVGVAGLLRPGPLGVPLVLLALAIVTLDAPNLMVSLFSSREWVIFPEDSDALGDFLLCAAVLGYAAGQSRLQGLNRQVVPIDPRLRGKAARQRSGRTLLPGEMTWLLVSLPFWAVLASLVWELLPDDWQALGLAPHFWRLVFIVWLCALAVMLKAIVVAMLSWEQRGRTVEEAVLFLQDVFWRETRREQRRLYRWLARERLRHERRKERT